MFTIFVCFRILWSNVCLIAVVLFIFVPRNIPHLIYLNSRCAEHTQNINHANHVDAASTRWTSKAPQMRSLVLSKPVACGSSDERQTTTLLCAPHTGLECRRLDAFQFGDEIVEVPLHHVRRAFAFLHSQTKTIEHFVIRLLIDRTNDGKQQHTSLAQSA